MGKRTGEEGIRWEENRRGTDKMGKRTGEEVIRWEENRRGREKME